MKTGMGFPYPTCLRLVMRLIAPSTVIKSIFRLNLPCLFLSLWQVFHFTPLRQYRLIPTTTQFATPLTITHPAAWTYRLSGLLPLIHPLLSITLPAAGIPFLNRIASLVIVCQLNPCSPPFVFLSSPLFTPIPLLSIPALLTTIMRSALSAINCHFDKDVVFLRTGCMSFNGAIGIL